MKNSLGRGFNGYCPLFKSTFFQHSSVMLSDIKLKHSTKIPYEELQIKLDLGDD